MTDGSPVTQVSWNDAAQFCNWLSTQEKLKPCYAASDLDQANGARWQPTPGDGYRLPSEAEWEFACRAGTTEQFSFGDLRSLLENYGWFERNTEGFPHGVGLKPANPFGLFDMHGNVTEWCQDPYGSDYYAKSPLVDPTGVANSNARAARGGGARSKAVLCRSAQRMPMPAVLRTEVVGFRVLRGVAPAADAGASSASPDRKGGDPRWRLGLAVCQISAKFRRRPSPASMPRWRSPPGGLGRISGNRSRAEKLAGHAAGADPTGRVPDGQHAKRNRRSPPDRRKGPDQGRYDGEPGNRTAAASRGADPAVSPGAPRK